MTWTEFVKKLPAVTAILALAYVGNEALKAGIDKATMVVVVAAIAGLGGFYLNQLLPPR